MIHQSAKRVVLYILLFFIPGFFWAQLPEDSLSLTRWVDGQAEFATCDKFGNIYMVSTDNRVIKFDSLGKQSAVFSSMRLGQAAFLDVGNPLRVLVWYPDFQTLLILDRTFNEMGRIAFPELGFYSVRGLSTAFDGNLWMYDDAVSRLYKIQIDGKILLESPALNVQFPTRFSASLIADNGRQVYLNDPQAGHCVLDPYAKLENVFPNTRFSGIALRDGKLFTMENQQICVQDKYGLPAACKPFPDKAVKSWLSAYGLLQQKGNRLERYSWN